MARRQQVAGLDDAAEAGCGPWPCPPTWPATPTTWPWPPPRLDDRRATARGRGRRRRAEAARADVAAGRRPGELDRRWPGAGEQSELRPRRRRWRSSSSTARAVHRRGRRGEAQEPRPRGGPGALRAARTGAGAAAWVAAGAGRAVPGVRPGGHHGPDHVSAEDAGPGRGRGRRASRPWPAASRRPSGLGRVQLARGRRGPAVQAAADAGPALADVAPLAELEAAR